MDKNVMRAHAEHLVDMARQFDQVGEEGASEVTYLARRTARMIYRTLQLEPDLITPEPYVSAPTRVLEPKDG